MSGWTDASAELAAGSIVLALDGPAVLDWETAVGGLRRALRQRGIPSETLDVRRYYAPWDQIVARTASAELPDDPDFSTLGRGTLATLFGRLPTTAPPKAGVQIVFGPGSALVAHDVLWYLDLPKRFAEAAVNAGQALNLGQPAGTVRATKRRLFYVDWPLLDRHRDAIAERIDRFVDLQNPTHPQSLDGTTLRRTALGLARRPFRTRPTFSAAPWGGHWAQRELRAALTNRNTALGYELIAPEAGVLIGDGSSSQVEVPFQLVVALAPGDMLGDEIHRTFGTSFPIRFDYLDTVGGGNLSVHCHPRAEYMSRVFGWPYTQHETYYMMVGGDGSKVFLGLQHEADVSAFHRQAREADQNSKPFEIEQFVQAHPASPHQLFIVPAGTPHGSGEGNVVLEVSATPYLYSLRFYDWLRRDVDGSQRPVHVEHAFANLNAERTGDTVSAELIQAPRSLRFGNGWREELLGQLSEMFFEVRRVVLETGRPYVDDTQGRFHVLNVVDGDGVVIRWGSGEHELNYAETLVVPAAVGRYTMARFGSRPVRVVKALVR